MKRITVASSIALVVVVLGAALLACTSTQALGTQGARGGKAGLSPAEEPTATPEEARRDEQVSRSIEEVKQDWEEHLLSLPGVTGVAIGLTKDGQQTAIKVYVKRKAPKQTTQIPEEIEGFPVIVEQRGPFRAWTTGP